MPKQATIWITDNGYDVVGTTASSSLLLEDGGLLLLETGFELLFEGGVVTPKAPTSYTTPSKVASSWQARDGLTSSTVGIEDTLTTEQGDTRTTEAGDTRTTDVVISTKKNPTGWTE